MPREVAVLSLRDAERGGDLRRTPRVRPATALFQRRLALLIHGYNNDAAAARASYDAFCARQREVAELPASRPASALPLVGVYWPGDADWGVASALYYPWAIARAKAAAQSLSAVLAEAVRLNGFKEVTIVAHSLGCRLALELLAALAGTPGIYVGRVVFMAAAVPVFMLTFGGSALRRAWDGLLREGALSLFSPGDAVLAWAFPLGQTLAGAGEGLFPTALGREYWGSAAAPPRLEQHEVVGAGHSDYWGGRSATRAQARQAAAHVRAFAGLGAVPARTIAARQRPAFAGAEPRVAAAGREQPLREVPAWEAS